MERETFSYLMMFCALLLIKKDRVTFEEAVQLAPLAGRARLLAGELLQQKALAG